MTFTDFNDSEDDIGCDCDEQRAGKTVWIIEAPGKIRQMEAILRDCLHLPDNTTFVEATKGHFITMPEALTDTGIDTDFFESERVADPSIVEKLCTAVTDADAVYIATDADQEGDVIAVDVLDTIRDIYPDPLRVRLKSLDNESIREALDQATSVNRDDATPGRTRAIVDRLIGSAFAHKNITAGRVKSAILGIVARRELAPYRLYMTAPSEDELLWSCHVDALPAGDASIANGKVEGIRFLDIETADRISKMRLPMLEVAATHSETPLPDDMGRIMVRAGDDLGMTPSESSAAMQAAYESGRLSYPRSDARGLSKSAVNKVGNIAKRNNLKFNRAVVKIKSDDETHDSPYPIGDVNINHDPAAVGGSEGIRILIARGLVNAGQVNKVSTHKRGPLAAFLVSQGIARDVAEFIDNLPWTKTRQLRMTGNKVKEGIFIRKIETIILEQCVQLGLGRPSTYASHIKSILESGAIGPDGRLTPKGEAIIDKTPKELLSPKFSAAIEKACKAPLRGGDAPWQKLAGLIVSKMPVTIKDVIVPVLSEPATPSLAELQHPVEHFNTATTREKEPIREKASPSPWD